jgi:hypothetical protein
LHVHPAVTISSKFTLKFIPCQPIIRSEAVIIQKGDQHAMEGIQNCTSACRTASNAAPVQFQGEAARLSYLNVSEDQSTDINIVTAEGDKVTLSSDYHSEATLLTYAHLAYSNSGYEAEKGELVNYNEERNVSLSVKGSLSDQEMADIQALLTDLGEMLKGFMTGEGEGAGGVDENSADLSRYSSLSAFEADFEYSASMQYLSLAADQLVVKTVGSPKLPESMAVSPAPALQPAATVAPTVVQSPQTVAPVAPVAAEPPKTVAVQDEQAAGKMAKKVKDSGLRPMRFMKLLKKFLRSLMQEMRANKAVDGQQAKRGESILEKFFDQVGKPPAESEIRVNQVSFEQASVKRFFEVKAEKTVQPAVEETV